MDMKEQRFGIEIEMTGITRKAAAEIAAAYFDTAANFDGTYYNTYSALDSQGRKWNFMSDSSISAQKKSGRQIVAASDDYKTEMVSPICRWDDIERVQELIRKLREAGAIANESCGIHVHVDASPFNANTLRNITNIMASKEDLIYKALQVTVARQHRWCKPVDARFLEELNRRKPQTLAQVSRIWYNGGDRSSVHYDDSRYHCLNLHSVFQKGTVEFRLFNSTTHAGKIKAYIQFCLAISAQALNQRCASRQKTQTTPVVKLRDLLHTKWEDIHLIHHEIENEPSTIVELDESTLTEAGKEAWADVLNADVLRVYTGYYGLQMELAGVKASRLDAFSSMLAGYCSVQDYEKWVNEPEDQPSLAPEMKL